MSTCISRNGEFSSHTPSPADPWLCDFCARFDEEGIRAAIARVEALADSATSCDELGHAWVRVKAEDIRAALADPEQSANEERA